MDRNTEALARITEEMAQGMRGSRKAKQIAKKLADGKATYADALTYAQENGRILKNSIRNNVGEVLHNGNLIKETAKTVIKIPMTESAAQVIDMAADIQQAMNDAAGIGIQAIRPEVNAEQIDGIIHEICNAESYAAGQDKFLTQVGNFLEGTVDDVARENAEFHYQAGLSPKIERRVVGKGCKFCDALAGVYDYEDVRDKNNPVFQRHKNCHCVVDYIPANGSRRQNVHTKQWTNDGRDDRIRAAEEGPTVIHHSRVYASDLKNGLPIMGEPNGITDKLNAAGEVIQRRKYGKNGKAAVDIDLSDHGESWKHPTGAHKHVFDYSGKKPKRKNAVLTPDDLDENADIIIKGVNYFEN